MIPLEIQVARVAVLNALIELQFKASDFKEVDRLQQIFDNIHLCNVAEDIANGEEMKR